MIAQPGKPRIRSFEGPASVQEAINFLNSAQPVPKLKWCQALAEAARYHVEDIGPAGLIGHISTDGKNPSERAKLFGKGGIAECCDTGPQKTGLEQMVRFIVDAGVPSRGHRYGVLDPDSKQTGIFTGYHKTDGTMTCIDYSSHFIPKQEYTPRAVTSVPQASAGTSKQVNTTERGYGTPIVAQKGPPASRGYGTPIVAQKGPPASSVPSVKEQR